MTNSVVTTFNNSVQALFTQCAESASPLITEIEKITNVVGPAMAYIVDVTVVSVLCALNPYLFTISVFIGVMRLERMEAGVQKIVELWQSHRALILAGIMLGAYLGLHPICIAVLGMSSITSGIYCGKKLQIRAETAYETA